MRRGASHTPALNAPNISRHSYYFPKLSLKWVRRLAQAVPVAYSSQLCCFTPSPGPGSMQLGKGVGVGGGLSSAGSAPRPNGQGLKSLPGLRPLSWTLGDPSAQLLQDTSGSSANESQLPGSPSSCGWNTAPRIPSPGATNRQPGTGGLAAAFFSHRTKRMISW